MIPRGDKGRHAGAPIKDCDLGLVVAMIQSPPGDGAVLHIHEQVVENFFCSVPRGVVRAFKNVQNETGRMLVILHNDTPEQKDRSTHSLDLRKQPEAEHSSEVFKSIEQIGLCFDAQFQGRA